MTAAYPYEQPRSMMSTTARVRTVLIAVALLAAGVAGSGAAAPSPTAPPPGLSIAIDNGAKSTKPDSEVSYTVTFANAGTDAVTAAIVASVPGYGKVTDAGGGQVAGQEVTWKVTVEGGKKQAETFRAHIGAIPKGTYRVTTLASVFLGDDTTGAPLIRSADSDAIPGVKEPVAGTPSPTATAQAASSTAPVAPIAIGIGGGVLIVAAAAVAILIVRRGRQPAGRRRRRE
jgi:hypothetical protein